MFSTDFSVFLKQHFGICKFLRCTPFEYHPKTGKLVRITSKNHIVQFKLQCLISVLYSTGMLLNLCFGSLTTAEKFQGFVFFLLYLTVIVMRWNYDLKIDGMQAINTFIEFERKVLNGKTKKH